jgi:hypothetical protein
MSRFLEPTNQTFTVMSNSIRQLESGIPEFGHTDIKDYPNFSLSTPSAALRTFHLVQPGSRFNYTLRDSKPSPALMRAYNEDIQEYVNWHLNMYDAAFQPRFINDKFWGLLVPREHGQFVPNGIATRTIKAKRDKTQILTLTVHLGNNLVFTAKTKMADHLRQFYLTVNGIEMYGYLKPMEMSVSPLSYFEKNYLCELIQKTIKDILPVFNQVEVFEV